MQAIIPLAGKGTRVRPHTHSRAKPLLRVANRPVLSYIIEQLRAEGVDEVIAVTGHLGGQVEQWLRAQFPNLLLRVVPQAEQRGTADAIAVAEPWVTGPSFIAFADTLFDADFSAVRRFRGADAIFWTRETDDWRSFGVAVADAGGRIRRLVEKPTELVSRLVTIGLFLVSDHRLMFEGVHDVLSRPPNRGEYYLTDAFQYMIDQGADIRTAPARGWHDCGTVGGLLDTNRIMLDRGHGILRQDGPPLVALAEGVETSGSRMGPYVSVAENTRVRGSRLQNTIVGSDCVIEDCDLRDSVIGDHVKLRGVSGTTNIGDHGEVS